MQRKRNDETCALPSHVASATVVTKEIRLEVGVADSEIEARVAFLRDIIAEAGQLALAYADDISALTVESKANAQDVVSRADRDVERGLRSRISERFPADGIMGEEYDTVEGSSGFLWVIDPIDGTSPYLAGLRDWCVTVAIRQGDNTVGGAVFDACKDELFIATAGQGAMLNDRRLQIDPMLNLKNGLCAVGANHRTPPEAASGFVHLLLADGGMFFRNGSGALMLANVAAGRLAAYYEPHMNAWDCLAGLLLVREAGGWTEDFPGPNKLRDGGVVAASGPGGAAQLRDLMARAARREVDR